jgi:hypothetical protein
VHNVVGAGRRRRDDLVVEGLIRDEVGLTLIFGYFFSNDVMIASTSFSEYPACFMNRALMVPESAPIEPAFELAPVTLQPDMTIPAAAAMPIAAITRRSRLLVTCM